MAFRRRQQGIPGQDSGCFSENPVICGFSPAKIVIIHTGKVVVDQTVCVDHFHGRSEMGGFFPVSAAHSAELKDKNRAKPLSSCQQTVAHGFDQFFLRQIRHLGIILGQE